MNQRKLIVILALLFTYSNNVFADELIFSAPPRGSEENERAMYEPLAKAMSKAIGKEVKYVHPNGFLEYSVKMQKGEYDIVFDGPHFSQWRVENLKHSILVNLPENLQFVVIMQKLNNKVNTMHDLVYNTVCAQMTPQLGTLMLLENYTEHAAEPQLHLVKGEEKVFSDFKKGECSAAVLRDKRFYKMSDTDRAQYKVVYKSNVAPNDAITVDNKITKEQRMALIKLLTNPEEMKVAKPIFDKFSRNAVAFDRADPQKFDGLDQLLSLSFGWDHKKISAR